MLTLNRGPISTMREPEGRLLEMSWDGCDESLRKELDWFWRDQRTLTDVTLFCDGGSVRAHKLVLALCSPYFLNMCIETQTGCSNSVISLRGVDLADFKVLLEFMYRGHVLVEESKIEHVVKLARALYVRGFGSERELRKKRERNGSVGSVFADSDGEENDENSQRRKVYIRPEEIALDDMPPNRVTRASLASQEVARTSRRLSESRGISPEKKEASVVDKACPKRPPLIAAKSPEKTGNASQEKSAQSPKPSPRKLREKTPAAENEAPKDADSKKESPRHVCKSCDFTAATATLLATHLVQKHHPISPIAAETPTSDKRSPEKPKESSGKEDGIPLMCDTCGFVAGNAGALGKHRNRHKQAENHTLSVSTQTSVPTAQPVTPVAASSAATASPPVKSSPAVTGTDIHMPLAASEHFKVIYDCPKCIKISFKTPNIMTRHLMKRHHGETVQPITRVNCGHCEHAFGADEHKDALAAHLKQAHGIDAHEVKDVVPVRIKDEPVDDVNPSAPGLPNHNHNNNNNTGVCSVGPAKPRSATLNGPTLNNDNDDGDDEDGDGGGGGSANCQSAPVNQSVTRPVERADQPVDTASNADTERASSRGSFVLSPTPSAGDRATVAGKRSRLSHDDEATIEAAEPGSVGTVAPLTPASTDLSRVKREADADELVIVENGVFHKCPQCNYHTSQEHFLKRHLIACHSNGSTEDPFLCKYCNFSTGHRSTIKSHLVMVHRDMTTKVKDCYRNAAEINRLEESTREETARRRRLHRSSGEKETTMAIVTATEAAASTTTTTMTTDAVDGKTTRKRKTFPGTETSSSSTSSATRITVTSGAGRTSPSTTTTTPTTRAKRNRRSAIESRQTRPPPTKSKSVSPKTPRSLQRLDAAMKLKKAALAKQRRRSDQSSLASSPGVIAKECRSSRSSSRLSTGELAAAAAEESTQNASQASAKKAPSSITGSARASTGAAAAGRSVDTHDGTTDVKETGGGGGGGTATREGCASTKEKDTKDLKCPDCTYVAKSQIMFDKHVSLHRSCDETKLALCELCGVVKLKVSMAYHMRKHEPRDTGPSGSAGKST